MSIEEELVEAPEIARLASLPSEFDVT